MSKGFGPIFQPTRFKDGIFTTQAQVDFSQANPVSEQLYTVATLADVEILGVNMYVTWAVTQPTPLELVCTVDGLSIIFIRTNPVSDSGYYPSFEPASALNNQATDTSFNDRATQACRLISGKSVLIQVRITWATTQPTPLVVKVTYKKLEV